MRRLKIYDTTVSREDILKERAIAYQHFSPKKRWEKLQSLLQLSLRLKEKALKNPQGKGIVLEKKWKKMERESLSDEMLLLLKTFYDYQVRYLIVGGFAVNRYGYSRTTGDIDIFIKDTKENRKHLIEALEKMGYGRFDVLMKAPIIAGYCEIMLDEGLYVDLMTDIPGLEASEFDNYYKMATVDQFEKYKIRYLHYNQLIENKKATNQTKDKLDIEELEKVRRWEKE